MLRILKKIRKQKAVYWEYLGPDQFNQPKFATPVELLVRWEETTQVFLNSKGVNQISKARVWLDESPTPAVPVKMQGVLWKGALASLDTNHQAKPFSNPGAWQISKIDEKPTLLATQFVRWAWL
jgi:hypothetical protein